MPDMMIYGGALAYQPRYGPRIWITGPGWLYEYRGNSGFVPSDDDQGERWRGRITGDVFVLVGRELERYTFDLHRITLIEVARDGSHWQAQRLEAETVPVSRPKWDDPIFVAHGLGWNTVVFP